MSGTQSTPLEGKDVIFFDPGKLTGWARLTDGSVFSSGEGDFLRAGRIARSHCCHPEADEWDGMHLTEKLVGWEQFNIMPQTWMMKGSQTAIEVIGMLRFVAEDEGATILPSISRQRKNMVSSELLQAFGWYRPGHGGHANDAARLLVSWLMTSNNLPQDKLSVVAEHVKSVSR
jgi:hypothetical protein